MRGLGHEVAESVEARETRSAPNAWLVAAAFGMQ